MALQLKSLLKTAGYPPQEVDKLMTVENYLTEEEKFNLAYNAWNVISQKYFALLNLETTQILEEISQGKRKYNVNDFEEVKTKLLHEVIEKLEVAESEQDIEEVKKQLAQHVSPPPPCKNRVRN